MPDTPLNPDALEAAEDELWAKHIDHEGLSIGYYEASELVVSTYLAAALPEVTEREQLTALADKIVLEDRRGTIWQKINGTWYTPGSKHDYSDQSVMLPARVLHRPSEQP